MAGVEFRLGRNDHLTVEDFLSHGPEGVEGIVVDAKYLHRHRVAIDAARQAGVAIHVEPLTERLVVEGLSTGEVDYGFESIDPAVDLATGAARDRLVDAVVGPQTDAASALTPPHFFVDSDEALDLHLALVRCTARRFAAPLRPILAVQRVFLDQPGRAELVARRLLHEGVRAVDLRISPLGGDNEGPIKIRSVLQILHAFHRSGVAVIMGSQGTIGETALAMGLAQGFSVGIGYRERYDHKAAISRQRKPTSSSGAGPRGPVAGVYLRGADITVSTGVGKEVFSDREVRIRVSCRLGACGQHIDGPTRDPRGHYLHARAADAAEILRRPEPWRPMQQRDRLVRAIDLRDLIDRHLPTRRLQTRTLRTLVDALDQRMQAAA